MFSCTSFLKTPAAYFAKPKDTWHAYTVTPHVPFPWVLSNLNAPEVDLCVCMSGWAPLCIQVCAESVSLTYSALYCSWKNIAENIVFKLSVHSVIQAGAGYLLASVKT